MYGSRAKQHTRGFSLIELVIVVVIIGIIGAIAIPRMSRGASGASDGALRANLAVLRNAIDLYAAEHGGTFPTLADLNKASIAVDTTGGGNPLLDYSNAAGTSIGTRSAADGRIYGPYLRSIPSLPVGASKGKSAFVAMLGDDGGWIYDATTGSIKANCVDSETDANNVKYNTY